MNGFADVGWLAAHLHRKADFADDIAGRRADNATANQPIRLLIEEELRKALVAPIRDGSAGSSPWKNRLAELDPLRPALVPGLAGPGRLWIGETSRGAVAAH